MPTKTIQLYEIHAKFTIRKDDWEKDQLEMTEEKIRDKIEAGIEIPIEDIQIKIIK